MKLPEALVVSEARFDEFMLSVLIPLRGLPEHSDLEALAEHFSSFIASETKVTHASVAGQGSGPLNTKFVVEPSEFKSYGDMCYFVRVLYGLQNTISIISNETRNYSTAGILRKYAAKVKEA